MISVSGNTSLIRKVWVREENSEMLLVTIECYQKQPEFSFTTDGPDRVVVIRPESSSWRLDRLGPIDQDALGDPAQVKIQISGWSTKELEIFVRDENHHQVRFLLVGKLFGLTTAHWENQKNNA